MTTAIAKAAGVADPAPQAAMEDKETDLESGLGKTKRPPSRISVPLSRRSSIRSQHLDDGQRDDHHGHDDDEDAEPDFEWGPNHPCFPHMNPHVPLDFPLYQSTRIIRIRRDWMVAGDLAPTFANLYPEILDPLINEDTFRQIIRKINDTLLEAFSPWSTRAWIDAILGIATLWLWDDAGFTGAKAKLRDLEKWLDQWNQQVGEREGVKIIPLRRTGYLTIDIQIPDPEIEVATRPPTHATDLSRLPHPTLSPPIDVDEDVTTDPHRDAPRTHGEFGPYPVQDLGTLRQSGQQHLAQATAVA